MTTRSFSKICCALRQQYITCIVKSDNNLLRSDVSKLKIHRRFFRTSENSNGKGKRKFTNLIKSLKYPLLVSCTCTAVVAYGYFSATKPHLSLDSQKDKFLPKPVNAFFSNYVSRFNFIADVVEKAGPAVVFLEIKGEHPESGKRVTMSNGSGFIVKSNGLILTSAHVVANKSKVVVKLHDMEILEGSVMAVDPVYDLAAIKIDVKKKLPFIPLGKSSEIRPGEFVVAMGSPLSLNNTVTSGIVSSSLRGSKELGLDNNNMQYIQTDAVISFGNSGGPLVNLDGKAIGINNLKVTSGISFAIPVDYAIGFLEEAERLMEKANNKTSYMPSGKESPHKRRYMGITMLTLTPPILDEFKDRLANFPDVDKGVYVHKVNVGSPAYDGGLHAGDIIIDINGREIKSTADISEVVEKEPRLRVTAIRGNYLQKIDVITEELF